MTIYSFTIWSPCKWTKHGQSLDSGKSIVCPSFVPEPFSFQNVSVSQFSLLGHILEKYQTHNQLMSSFWPLSLAARLQPRHGPFQAHLDKLSDNGGAEIVQFCPTLVHAMSTVCLSEHGTDHGWAVDGPQAMTQARCVLTW